MYGLKEMFGNKALSVTEMFLKLFDRLMGHLFCWKPEPIWFPSPVIASCMFSLVQFLGMGHNVFFLCPFPRERLRNPSDPTETLILLPLRWGRGWMRCLSWVEKQVYLFSRDLTFCHKKGYELSLLSNVFADALICIRKHVSAVNHCLDLNFSNIFFEMEGPWV